MVKKRFWYLIGIGVVILFFFIFLSNVMSVGIKLREIHEYVEYGFYGLAVILMYILIINPLRVILFAPTFSIDALLDDSKKYRLYKDAAKVLLTNEYLTEEDKTLIRDNYKDKEGTKIERAYWHNVVVRGGLVSVVENYVKKGQEIAVEGKLTNRSYETKEGEKRYVTEILVNDLLLLGSK